MLKIKRQNDGSLIFVDEIYKILYSAVMKPVIFIGTSLEDLRAFPQDARREAGFQIGNVQLGKKPFDWKPVKNIGAGVEKTKKTRKHDLDLGRKRYKEMLRERTKI